MSERKPKYTPGPWICCNTHVDDSCGLPLIKDARDYDGVNCADHHLIAAAPALFELARAVLRDPALSPCISGLASCDHCDNCAWHELHRCIEQLESKVME